MSAAIQLPATLNRQFELLERRLWRMDVAISASGAFGALLISLTFQFCSDRLWDTPHWLRLLFASGGWLGFSLFAWRYATSWIWSRPNSRTLAVIVQKRYRRLGDRLLGIVELADPAARPSHYSTELCAAAIAQVAGEASSIDFQDAASNPKPRRYLVAFLALAFLVALFGIATPAAGWNALLRWLRPTSNVDRYTFVTLDTLPDHLVVAQGEPFQINVGVAHGSFWHPAAARFHLDDLPSNSVPLLNDVATIKLAGQTQPRLLWLSVGDVTRSVQIQPAVRPDLLEMRAQLQLPAYLQYPPGDQVIQGGVLNFLPGTTATITAKAVRDLASATLAPGIPLKTTGPRFTTLPLLLELSRDLTFSWRDALGLAGPAAQTIHAIPHEDEAPAVDLHGLSAAIAMLPEETVPIDLASTDDYGVRHLTLAWQRASTGPEDPPGPLHELSVAIGRPQAKTLAGHYDLSPALLRIPEDTTILVRGLCIDYYPGRQPSSTAIYRIHILGRESHARLIHDQFEKILEQLEELARRQEAIMQAGKTTRSQAPAKLANEQSAQQLAQQSTDQRQTATQLNDLAKQTASTLAEAMRNPQISQDTLSQWAKHASQMAQLASQSMPIAAQSLDASRTDSTQRPQKLDQALSQEQDIVNAMRQLQKQGNDNLEKLMAQTLAARLRHSAATEREIADGFQKTLPDTIGMTAQQLPTDFRHAIDGMSTRHNGVTSEAARLQEEISRLSDRTALARYADVAREMDGFKTNDALSGLAGLIEKNVSVQSIETTRHWADQFEKWADRLSQKDDSKSQQGQPGQPDPAQMQALLALMRLRQQQAQLREQTSVVEEQKQTSPDYPGAARDAADHQAALRDQTANLAQDSSFPVPPEKMTPIAKSMGGAANLLARPETGQPTYNAQTDTINLLDEAIAQQAKNAGASAASLAAMMGMGPANSGKGNTSGGTTNQSNVQIPGSREGSADTQRTVIQAGGIDNSKIPAEFRDAIQGYQRAIEHAQP